MADALLETISSPHTASTNLRLIVMVIPRFWLMRLFVFVKITPAQDEKRTIRELLQ